MCIKVCRYTSDLEYKQEVGCFVKKNQEVVNVNLMEIKDRKFRYKIIQDRRKFIKRVEKEGTDMLSGQAKEFIEVWYETCKRTIDKISSQHSIEYAMEELDRYYLGPFYQEE